MRYAEVLLMAAEAHVMGGGSADKAVKYINEIRTRAKLAPLSSVTLDDVKKEKRLELCLESVRFQDLVRWGMQKLCWVSKVSLFRLMDISRKLILPQVK